MKAESCLPDPIRIWLEHRGYAKFRRVSGGRNNRVFCVEGAKGQAALKIYQRDASDPRDRFFAEKTFYHLVAKSGVSAPGLLDSDEDLGVSLLSWLDGGALEGKILREDVQSATSFVLGIQTAATVSQKPGMRASEACFSLREHTELLQNRMKRLTDSSIHVPEILEFIESVLTPCAQAAVKAVQGAASADFAVLGQPRIYSPGDFGLHNAMRLSSGALAFFDFEYSGWDDPVKTVADIYLQPEKPVDWGYLSETCQAFQAWPGLEHRVRAWIPFFSVKWAVILLSHALKAVSKPGLPADEGSENLLMQRQISKAGEVLKRGEI